MNLFLLNSRVVWPPNSSRSTNMSHEKTVEELIYELAECAMVLWFSRLSTTDLPFSFFRENYDFFKTRALKLEVELPDLTEDALSEQFLLDQITNVKEHINLNKTLAISQLYECSFTASLFILNMSEVKNTDRSQARLHRIFIRGSLRKPRQQRQWERF